MRTFDMSGWRGRRHRVGMRALVRVCGGALLLTIIDVTLEGGHVKVERRWGWERQKQRARIWVFRDDVAPMSIYG